MTQTRTHLRRAAGVLMVAAGFAMSSLPASAATATAGSLGVAPRNGTVTSALTLTTTARCPSGTNIEARIFGHGFPAQGQIAVGNTAISAYDTTHAGGLLIPVSMTLRDIGNLGSPAVTYTGSYRLVVSCRDRVRLGSLGDFVGTLHFRDPRSYRADEPASMPQGVASAAPLDTSGSAGPSAGGNGASVGKGSASAGGQGGVAAGPNTGYVVARPSSHRWGIAGFVIAALGLAVVGAGAVRISRQRRSLATRG